MNDFLKHYGVKGMKWGVRRYQDSDGRLTSEGKKHKKEVLFVSGSSKTQDETSEYYRKSLPKSVIDKLNTSMNSGEKIIVGDAPGIDRQVQDYLNSMNYRKVEIYGPGKQVRYSANSKWKTNPIDDPEHEPGSKEWLAKKDVAMTKAASKGLAVVLDEGAKATRKNVERLVSQNKDVDVHMLSKSGESEDKVFLGKDFVLKFMNGG